MRVLVATNMYPTPQRPASGVFVRDQVESLRRLGIEVDVLFMDGRRSKLNYLTAFPRFWGQLRRGRYDLVHAHYWMAGVVARAQWRRPVVLTHHGIETIKTWEARFSRRVTPWFDQVIVVSQEMRERLPYPKVHVIPCGVDLERFRPVPRDEARAALGLPLDRKLVLWAGDPTRREKRFELVEAAVALLRGEDPSVELVLLAGKPHAEVPGYMSACDVLLLVSDAEGSPMVVKEAMACNLPVVSTPVGDVPQVIGGTDGCYLCTQEPADIAQKLRRALERRERTRGRAAVQHLGLEAVARQVASVYRETLSRRPGREQAGAPEPASRG